MGVVVTPLSVAVTAPEMHAESVMLASLTNIPGQNDSPATGCQNTYSEGDRWPGLTSLLPPTISMKRLLPLNWAVASTHDNAYDVVLLLDQDLDYCVTHYLSFFLDVYLSSICIYDVRQWRSSRLYCH